MCATPSDPVATLRDRIDPARAAALHATLDRPGPPPGPGDPLPPFWHWIQFWDPRHPGDLGRDGHPRTGGLIPDLGLPRRMWAGGRLAFHSPLVIGEDAERRTTLASVARKTGRSGPLAFVTLRHEIHQSGSLRVTEEQDLVYREDPAGPAPNTAKAPKPLGAVARSYRASTTQLFRYSALTFNGHRIHYDLDYARDVEGYGGLVVHGPLLAQHLIDLATDTLGDLAAFSFRALAPVTHDTPFHATRAPDRDALNLAILRDDGTEAMTASATPIAQQAP
ncbi:MAG: MaoC family dehydratase N-terminal domain-containing protein [Pseudomonadota bacterium]